MYNRQATRLLFLISLLFGLSACSPPFDYAQDTPELPLPTPTFIPPTLTPTHLLPTEVPPTPTATPLTCLSAPGELVTDEVTTEERPIALTVYLPPCYEQFPDQRYPVLYLLNGQPFSKDPYPPGQQWLRIGAPEAADELLHSGQAAPFIIVFPEDRYWNLQQGLRFGEYFLNNVIPHIDGNYRTLADRPQRAIGGLSRGGGWAFKLGFTRPELFGTLGLHSAAIFGEDRASYERWLRAMSPDLWPRLYLDVGDNDLERDFNIRLETVFTGFGIPHEWHLNTGAHDEAYWSDHVEEYLQWYAEGWQ